MKNHLVTNLTSSNNGNICSLDVDIDGNFRGLPNFTACSCHSNSNVAFKWFKIKLGGRKEQSRGNGKQISNIDTKDIEKI